MPSLPEVPYTTALVMIVRDEARCLARCLDSVRPWVDHLLVLDTGSCDDTPGIAARCGAQVEHFAWCDDFAAARNAALEHCRSDWRLVLDADEWIAGGADSLQALHREPPRFVAQVRVDSLLTGSTGHTAAVAPSWITRVLPRGVYYRGSVHEQADSALPRRRLGLQIRHDGYLVEHAAAKRGRNRRLLQAALNSAPTDAYLHYQLGKDFEVNAEYASAEPHYSRAWAATGPNDGWCHDVLLRLLFTLKKLQRFERALQLAEAQMPLWPHSPDFFFTLGDLLLDWAAAEPARAAHLLPMIESSWLRALAIGEQPELQDTVQGRGSFLAAHNLAVFHASLGDAAQAAHWRERAAAGRGD